MRRILFVSRVFPSDFESSVYGILQRLRILLMASAQAAEHLDVLFFVEPSYLATADSSKFQQQLEREWGVRANVTFASRAAGRVGRWQANAAPMIDFRQHPGLRKMNGALPVHAVEASLSDETQLIVAFLLDSSLPLTNAGGVSVPFVLDLNDIMFRALGREVRRRPFRLADALHWPALFFGERKAIRKSAVSLVCSDRDRVYLKGIEPEARVEVAPNAVEFREQIPERDRDASPVLLFIGTFSYGPNVDAAEWLVRGILPRVLKKVPRVQLVLVGGNIDRLKHLRSLSPNVEFRGFVADLRDAYRDASISCSPITGGGGTRTKIIEASSFGVPVVSTTIGAEGIDFVPGSEIVIADSEEAFADACVELLNDPERADAIGRRSFEKGRSLYSRSRVIDQIADILRSATA